MIQTEIISVEADYVFQTRSGCRPNLEQSQNNPIWQFPTGAVFWGLCAYQSLLVGGLPSQPLVLSLVYG